MKTIFKDKGKIAISEKINGFFSTKFYDNYDSVIVGHMHDTYIGCCTYRDGITKGRGKKEDVVGLHAFWIDIDFQDDVHKKDGLVSREKVDEVLKEFPQPTVKVCSGYGYHLWYALKESVDVTRKEDKQLWEHRVKMFQDTFRKHFTVDATHNLDRILRVPNTMNLKRDPVLVTAEYNKVKYEYRDLMPVEPQVVTENVTEHIPVTSNGKAPVEKINALCAQNKAFCDVYHGKQSVGDGTPSAIDFSLAVYCLKEEFEPGEVKETLIMSHIVREGKRNKKHGRQDYFDRTITRASQVVESEMLLGLKVFKFVKYNADPPHYELVTDKGVINMPAIGDLLSVSKFRVRVAESLNFIPSLPKQKDWTPIAERIFSYLDIVDLGSEGTDESLILQYIEEYCLTEGVVEDGAGNIFTSDGFLYIVLGQFRKWLDTHQRFSVTAKRLAFLMRKNGFKPASKRIGDEVIRSWEKRQ